MSENGQQRSTFLVCKHCGKVTTIAENAQNDPLKAVSQEIDAPHPKTIKNALKRLDMYPTKKKGEKNDKKTLRTDSEDDRETHGSNTRHDSLEGQPSFGPVHNF